MRGYTGNGISNIAKTGTSGLIDTYTITYTDGNTTTFTVSNGKGISSIVKTGSAGLVDTYRITYNDGTYFDYTVTNGEDGEVTEEELQDVYEQMSSELEDSTATGTSIDTTDSAYWGTKIGLSGNTSQATNIITYSCTGNESGDYYFVYNNINYQFTMPTISSGDVIYFNTDTLKLYLEDIEITTSIASTGILITMKNTPNPDYPQDIQVVKGSNNIEITNSDNTQSQNYPITLPTGMELCKIGNNQDYIYKNLMNGNWYKHSEIGKFGMNTLANLFDNITYFQSNFNSNNGIISLRLYKDLFSNLNIKNVSFNNYYNEKLKSQNGGWNDVNSKYCFSNIDGLTIWLHYNDLGLNDWTVGIIPNLANRLTNYLGDTNFYLPLRTPTETQITDTTLINQLNDIEKKLKTYQGVSHITQTNADLPFVLTLDYKKSNLLSPLTSEQKAEIVQSSVTQVETDIQPTITSIQNTANTAQSTAETAQSTANTAQNIAKGANQALSYSNYSAMVTAFNNLANNVYKVGQNVMIITLEVPDLWISSIENTSQSYTYTTDSAFTTELSTNGYVQVGYYRLSALETQKVDLINYEQNTNKVTSISSSSTNTQYPSAKAVYDYIQSLDGDEVSY